MQWPALLTELKVGGYFSFAAPSAEQPDGCHFPPSLRVLDVRGYGEVELQHLRFPTGLEVLYLPDPEERESAAEANEISIEWPSRLRVLHLPSNHSELREFRIAFALPASLRELHVGEGGTR
jgi:hypothetical protein